LSPTVRRSLEWLLFALLTAWFVKSALVPAWRSLNTDFPNYLLAATLYRKGFPFERVYDWVWFERQKDHAGWAAGIVGFIPLTPFSALLFVPLTGLAPLAAKHVWLVLNLAFLCLVAWLLRRLTRLSLLHAALLMLLTVVPLQTSFMFGQQHLLVLLLLTLAAWCHVREKDATAGALLAVAAAIKIYPALFGLYFLVKRRWRAASALALTGICLFAVALIVFGAETVRVYVTEVLPRALAGEGNDPYYAGFNTPTVVLRRLFIEEPDLNPHPALHAPLAFALLSPLVATLLVGSLFWFVAPAAVSDQRRRLEWGAFVTLLLVLSTSSSTYHFCALILATTLIVDVLLQSGHTRAALLLVGLHALVSAPLYGHVPREPAGWSVFFGVPRLYGLLMYWGVVLWALARVERARTPRAHLALGASLLVLYLWGIRSTLHHMDAQPAGERVRIDHATLVATSPALRRGDVYFSRMGDEAYVLDGTGCPAQAKASPDLFHPTFSATGEGWVEVSSERSQVVRIGVGCDATHPDILDAESPVASRDGKRLLFQRESDHGRTSLWIKREASVEARLTDETLYVLDAAFSADDRIVVSARRDGEVSLFALEEGALRSWPTAAKSPRYPAFSPDGAKMAYAGLEAGAWQIHVQDLRTSADEQLTHGDCSSVSPAWAGDSRTLFYASDCGRNLGNTSIRSIAVSSRARDR
jgi:hypothetical protein